MSKNSELAIDVLNISKTLEHTLNEFYSKWGFIPTIEISKGHLPEGLLNINVTITELTK